MSGVVRDSHRQRQQRERDQRRLRRYAPSAASGDRPLPANMRAADLLAALPEIAEANGRWNAALDDEIRTLITRWGGLEIGAYEIVRTPAVYGGWRPFRYQLQPARVTVSPSPADLQLKFAVAMANEDPTRSAAETSEVRLIGYLLGARGGAPPGWGSLGTLRQVGRVMEGRPTFDTEIASAMRSVPGMARRHITAWHNIRDLLNAIRADAGRMRVLHEVLGGVSSELRCRGEKLLLNANKSVLGGAASNDAQRQDTQTVMLAAFAMFNQRRNLWSGAGRENTEIALFSARVQDYASHYAAGRLSDARLAEAISRCSVGSEKARGVKSRLLAEIDALVRTPHTREQLTDKIYESLYELEVDLPSGGLPEVEERVHRDLYDFLYRGGTLDDARLREILAFFLTGEPPGAARASSTAGSWWRWF